MKFKLLAIGQRFRYQGEVYVKTAPLVASHVESGHNKMIPAYATLEPLDSSETEQPLREKTTLDSDKVLDAFNAFYAECLPLVEDKAALQAARERFLQQLND